MKKWDCNEVMKKYINLAEKLESLIDCGNIYATRTAVPCTTAQAMSNDFRE